MMKLLQVSKRCFASVCEGQPAILSSGACRAYTLLQNLPSDVQKSTSTVEFSTSTADFCAKGLSFFATVK